MPRILLLVLLIALGLSAQQPFDPDQLSAMKARAIGPATMSGRVAAIAATPGAERIYVGAATGGLWVSDDAGLSWTPIFDEEAVASIGALALDPNNPDVLWVGTGEGNPRNSASVGKGIYRSLDGGESFELMGLEATEHIHRVIVHPQDSNTVWAAALGRAWGENEERGVYKTTDGGKSWRRILYVDERSGCADLELDPSNPNKLIAALWDFRREPHTFRSGGPGSGLWISHDGGESWARRGEDEGLPEGDLGRMGLAIAPSDPRRVYVYVECEDDNVIVRSDDGGKSFATVGKGANIGNRPFYYADLRVDPVDANRVYSLWSQVSVSEDAGKTFRILAGWDEAHPDHHALWIDPEDPKLLINGNDGGISISRDHGKSWRFARNLPLAQFYHVNVDMDLPYNIYGGLQDNGSWRGPSRIWRSGGIRNHDWQEVCFGDGFDTSPHPDDSTIGYAMSQQGYIVRWNLATGERKDIKPLGPEGTELRFSWNAAFAQDPFDADTIYFGSQFVHRSRDRGESWERISEDLTTNRPEWQKQQDSGGLTPDVTGAENFTTLIALAPSPIERDLIWAGSDDGRLHLTRDGGKSWTSLEDRLPGLATHAWLPHIHASSHDAGSVFVVFDDHRRSNWETYLYRSDNYGETFARVPVEGVYGYAHVVVQHPDNADLLFLGTEFGLWCSVDAGSSWFKWTHGVPTVAVRDLVIHPRDGDLIVATHGRALFVVDDLLPLAMLSESRRREPLTVFPPPVAYAARTGQPASSRFPGQGEFRGENASSGAMLSFWLAEEPEGKATVEVFDLEGKRMRRFETDAEAGMNRVNWDLRQRGFRRPGSARDGEPPAGSQVLPGNYRLRVSVGDASSETLLVLRADPRESLSWAEREAKVAAESEVGRLMEDAAKLLDGVSDLRADLATLKARRKRSKSASPAMKRLDTLLDEAKGRIDEEEKRLRPLAGAKGIRRNVGVISKIGAARRGISSHSGAPTQAQAERLRRAKGEFQKVAGEVRGALATLRGELAKASDAAGLNRLIEP